MTSKGYRHAFFSKLGLSVVDNLPEQFVVSLHHLSMFARGLGFQLDLPAVEPLRGLLGRESCFTIGDEHSHAAVKPKPVTGDGLDD